MVLAVLSHISGHAHPQKDIVKPLNLQKPLKGAMMVAPWVSSAPSSSSNNNHYRDYVNSYLANVSASFRCLSSADSRQVLD